MKAIIFSFVLVLILCPALRSDEIIEGTKRISYNFEFTNLDKFPDYVFLAYPVNQSGGVPELRGIEIENNKPVYMICKYGSPVIYAIKKDLFSAEEIKESSKFGVDKNLRLDSFFTKNPNMVPSYRIYCITNVDKSEPYGSITDQYEVKSVGQDTMMINRIKSVRKKENGSVYDEVLDDGQGDLLIEPSRSKASNYIYYSLPLLSLIGIATFIIIRKKKK